MQASRRAITEKIYKGFLQDGVDIVLTNGKSIHGTNREIFEFIKDAKKNEFVSKLPERTLGNGIAYITVNQIGVRLCYHLLVEYFMSECR